MLFSLGRPVTFAGYLVAFLLALVLRAVAIRYTGRAVGLADRHDSVRPRLREDIDPFGAVVAAVAGGGFGKMIDVDEVSRWRGRGKAALVFAAGPIVVLLAAQLVLLVVRLLFPTAGFEFGDGLGTAAGAGFLIALAVGLLQFGLLALIPMPPLDGFGLLWSAQRNPGPGMQGYRLWFQHKNIGVVVLVVLAFFPLGGPFLLLPVNLIAGLILMLWGI